MNNQTFELELVQLEELFSKSRSNKYSDSRKNKFFDELYATFEAIINSDYKNFDISEQEAHREIFEFLFDGLEFLDTSTLNIIPFELVHCLGRALNDWVTNDDLIIVTSLSHRRNDIWFEGWREETLRNIKDLIYSKYKIKISNRLIRISLPKSLSRDYLAGVVLYHELGHFIDLELNITEKIFFDTYNKSSDFISSNDEFHFYHYTKEYFADLFAAQYVGNASACYLNHLAYNYGDSEKHPATEKRNRIVEKFLLKQNDPIIETIQNALDKMGHELLKMRHSIFNHQNCEFTKLIPENITNDMELHAIYKLGWDLWMNSASNFLSDFTRRQKYYVINNLIEKSISNYYVKESWKASESKEIN